MRSVILCLPAILLISVSACGQENPRDRPVGGGCDGCSMMYDGMPQQLSPHANLSPPDEAGTPMVISGTIFKKDGKTPAPDVILYVYHTDDKGYYSNLPGDGGTRHGHLRGWMKTDATGHYEFKSIRPAPYPGGKDPAHIHPLIKETGLSLYWIDEFIFEDDPLVTAQVRASERHRGGSGIIRLTKNSNGVWVGHRDIILGMNIPGY